MTRWSSSGCGPQGLKPAFLLALYGTAKSRALPRVPKMTRWSASGFGPQGLKPAFYWPCTARLEAVPFHEMIYGTGLAAVAHFEFLAVSPIRRYVPREIPFDSAQGVLSARW